MNRIEIEVLGSQAALAAFTREGPAGAEERVDRMMQIPGLMQVVLFRA